MRPLLALTFLAVPCFAFADEAPKIKVIGSPAIPKGEVRLVKAGTPLADRNVERSIPAKEYGQELELTAGGPFDVYFVQKGGKAVLAIANWKAERGTTELKLSSHLGTVLVRGDDLPRADSIVLTAPDDAGPGEKGHLAIQTAKDYKDDLVVPAGFYAVWIVPVNGAKAQKIADKIRVLAGRETPVPE